MIFYKASNKQHIIKEDSIAVVGGSTLDYSFYSVRFVCVVSVCYMVKKVLYRSTSSSHTISLRDN